ncbi:MAG TPA: 16S rRNA (cytidine(1402)-2'-O)-methyltransferase, partial [Armatimonadota bacterium]|nr:16S rRNA (cytidine(1402)-2'-O)-methyltransferase [Armatimonadota bacterium]
MEKPGTLYIVSTPIGNLEDITLRALRVLKEVDLIAAEDTRVTRKLLSHYDIHTPMTAYHQHSRGGRAQEILERILAGDDVAVVSDAGTPGISDPGHELIRLAIEADVPVVAVPGASAVITALVVSGLPTSHFAF